MRLAVALSLVALPAAAWEAELTLRPGGPASAVLGEGAGWNESMAFLATGTADGTPCAEAQTLWLDFFFGPRSDDAVQLLVDIGRDTMGDWVLLDAESYLTVQAGSDKHAEYHASPDDGIELVEAICRGGDAVEVEVEFLSKLALISGAGPDSRTMRGRVRSAMPVLPQSDH